MPDKVVTNLTRFWCGAGTWAFPPHCVLRVPEEGIIAEMLAETAGDSPRLRIEDADPEPLVVIDVDAGDRSS